MNGTPQEVVVGVDRGFLAEKGNLDASVGESEYLWLVNEYTGPIPG